MIVFQVLEKTAPRINQACPIDFVALLISL
jgi:hypothetical protein